MQHNIDLTKPRNRRIQEICEEWFHNQCRTACPGEDEQWSNCLLSLLNEAVEFFKALKNCVRNIEKDESSVQLFYDWNFRRKRYHPPYMFDELIAIVSSDLGRDAIDIELLRKRFYDRWVNELKMRPGNYNFNDEARKLIEHALLFEMTAVLPITGNDIIKEFNVQPGPRVGEILKIAKIIYDSNPCPRNDLIQKLRDEICGFND